MKKILFFASLIIAVGIMESCKPKPACGTKREKAKKYNKLKSNPNFNM